MLSHVLGLQRACFALRMVFGIQGLHNNWMINKYYPTNNWIINPKPVVLILKKVKGAQRGHPPSWIVSIFLFQIGLLFIQLELIEEELEVGSGLFSSIFEGFWAEVCKGYSFDFKSYSDNSVSTWPYFSAIPCLVQSYQKQTVCQIEELAPPQPSRVGSVPSGVLAATPLNH